MALPRSASSLLLFLLLLPLAPAAQDYILSFRSYRPQQQHAALLKLLPQEAQQHIAVRHRNNPAALLPTDFIVVGLADAAVREALLALPGVKSLALEKRLTRRPLQLDTHAETHAEEAHAEDAVNTDDTEERYPRPPRQQQTHSPHHHGNLSFHAIRPSAWSFEDTAAPHGRRDCSGRRCLLSNAASGAAPQLAQSGRAAERLNASRLWNLGYTGQGIKVGIFDTGLVDNHPHFMHVAERTDWTDEDTTIDGLGHGSFVAGVIASTAAECPGLAPEAELHIFRVFTNKQVSYTSWFLDAFNYAIHRRLHVINLSIGGPDFMDRPFVEKVNEVTANGIIMVSAIGNDGPLFGTLNNPGDQNDVIGVGGIDGAERLAPFSSRGMTTWELPQGYGRMKPDLVTYGTSVLGSKITGGCRALSGTSVASPVAAGAVALLASVVPEAERSQLVNPASLKQALVSTAKRLPKERRNIFEQGQGMLDLEAAAIFLDRYTPQATLLPPVFDTTDCPYMWPYCAQGLYYTAQPLLANITILNGLGVTGYLDGPITWHPDSKKNGDLIDVSASVSAVLWPWSGSLSLRVSVKEAARHLHTTAAGELRFAIVSPVTAAPDSKAARSEGPSKEEGGGGRNGDDAAESESRMRAAAAGSASSPDAEPSPSPTAAGAGSGGSASTATQYKRAELRLPIRIQIIPTPSRRRRLLWDQYHSMAYPPGYIPRDDLSQRADPLDWNGDHPHTNFRSFFQYLRRHGYFLEILTQPWTCFDAKQYGALLLVDPEEEFFEAEMTHLRRAVEQDGLNLLVVGDWYSTATMEAVRFYDDNTRNWWFPETGGANIPALNELLGPWGVVFGSQVMQGRFSYRGKVIDYRSGTSLIGFPAGGKVVSALLNDLTASGGGADTSGNFGSSSQNLKRVPILGMYAVSSERGAGGKMAELGDVGGRLAVYGDSGCLDDSHSEGSPRCLELLDAMLAYLEGHDNSDALVPLLDVSQTLEFPMTVQPQDWPQRSRRSTLHLYSSVLEREQEGAVEEEEAQQGVTRQSSESRAGQPYVPVKRALPLCERTAWLKASGGGGTGGEHQPQESESATFEPASIAKDTMNVAVTHAPRDGVEGKLGGGEYVAPHRWVPRPEKGASLQWGGGGGAGGARWLSLRWVGLLLVAVGAAFLLLTNLTRVWGGGSGGGVAALWTVKPVMVSVGGDGSAGAGAGGGGGGLVGVAASGATLAVNRAFFPRSRSTSLGSNGKSGGGVDSAA